MKALSLQEPYAWLVLQLADPANRDNPIKPFENRSWPLPRSFLPQRIFIHASLSMHDIPIESIKKMMNGEQLARLGTGLEEIYRIWDLHRDDREGLRRSGYFGCILGTVEIIGQVTFHPSPWFSGPYGFLLKRPVLFPPEKRLPCQGQPGFFEINLD